MIDPQTITATDRRRRLLQGATGAPGARRSRQESGQALVEFALVLPVLILLVVGIIDFGFAFNSWNTTQNAAREGARIAAVSNSEATIKNRAKLAGGTVGIQGAEVTLQCNRPLVNGVVNNTFYDCTQNLDDQSGTCTNGPCSTPGNWKEVEGDIVQVRVAHAYKFITPLPRLIGMGNSVFVKASIQTRYEG